MTELPDQPDAAHIAAQVERDRLRLLFEQSLVAVLGSFIAALLLCWMLWERANHGMMIGWLVLLALAISARLLLFLRWHRAPAGQREPTRWLRPYWLTLLVSASLWGFGALLVMPKDSLLHQAITLLFAVGMAGSALSTYSAYRGMMLCAGALALYPVALWLLLQPAPHQYGLALTTVLLSVSAVRATRVVSDAMERSFRLTHEMALAHRLADHAARTDELTGLANRRAFFERAEQMLRYCQRNGRALCALVLDIDHFKQINDGYGHAVGDAALRRLGQLLRDSVRDADASGRLGGEEFVVLLADTERAAAAQVAEKLRAAIADLSIALAAGASLRITASIGVAAADRADYDLQTLLRQADEAMYRAKEAGRNRVVVDGDD